MTDDPAPRRALIAGLGHMGSLHARILSQVDGVEIVAVVEPDVRRRELFTRRHAGVSAYATFEQAIAEVEIDFACLAAPAHALPLLGRSALEAGIPFLIEKPVGPDEDDALELAREATRRGVLIAVGHVERCNPAVIA